MGSLNPVVLMPGALAERGPAIADELTASVTGSAGQFCTKPGIVFLIDDAAGQAFVTALAEKFSAVGRQVLLGPLGLERLVAGVSQLRSAGARLVAGDAEAPPGCRHPATLLEVSAAELIARPDRLLVEAFGNATMLVRAASLDELTSALALVPGALGASLYLAKDGRDDTPAASVQPLLEARTGRLIENRMPTGLAVTPPMQHGGPWPSAAPPFFSAVGMPWSILRFARRLCFDAVSAARLPDCLRDTPPPGRPWRFIDSAWVRG
jgi:NADP-dependent aldehyde dehydrogenase